MTSTHAQVPAGGAASSPAGTARGLLAQDARAQAAALKAGAVTPVELVSAALARIDEMDPRCWAISWLRSEQALAEADAADPAAPDAAPFAGVPILLKDHRAQAAGQETRYGTTALADAASDWDSGSNVHAALAAQGFIVLGRTTTPEFATHLLTESAATGITRSPFLPERVSGGSSGGSAAAVASGMVAVAHATDGGGSIRVPASCCGVVGLKPSRGRISLGPAGGGESWGGATVEGVLTRTVGDSAAVTANMSRRFPGDLYLAPGELPAEPPAAPENLCIGVMSSDPYGEPWHPEVLRVLRETVAALAGRGHDVVDSFPEALTEAAAFNERVRLMISVDLELLAQRVEARLGRELHAREIAPRNTAHRHRARSTSAADYLAEKYWLNEWSGRVQSWFEDGWDVLLLPTLGALPALAGEESDLKDAAALDASMDRRLAEMRPMTNFFNTSGLPAISLPLGQTEEGIPIGMQLVARLGDEATLLGLAAEFEQHGPWHPARPFG
ncbi:amidase [Nesterenkonia populi]